MSVLHRLLAGIEFSIDRSTGDVRWPARAEDLLRMANEIRQIARGQLALAAIGTCPDGSHCGQIDCWTAAAEESLQSLWQSITGGSGSAEIGVWFGEPISEWCAAARESQMDLLLIPRESTARATSHSQDAGCPLWIMGTEYDHQLGSEPPLIAVVDDLSSEAERYLPWAVEMAHAWSARLLVVHPLPHPVADLSEDRTDQLRREIFIRLSRTDYRSLPWGSQLHFDETDCAQLFRGQLTDQIPNLVLCAQSPAADFKGHVMVWNRSIID